MGFFRFGAAVAAALLMPGVAHASWRMAATDHFVIYSEQAPSQLQSFAEKLERFDSAMRLLNAVPDNPVGKANRLTVYVVNDIDAVQRLYGKGARSGNAGVAGFYIPRATGSVAFVPRPSGGDNLGGLDGQIVLLHEYAHHFMFQNFPAAYPAWFAEGFAEFYSTARFEKDGKLDIGVVAQHRAYGLLHLDPVPLEKLVAVGSGKINGATREAIYGRGWLLLHYMTAEPSRDKQLHDYLNRVNRGETSLAAAQAAFGDLKALDRELDSYLRKRISYWSIASEKLKAGRIELRELSPAENAIMGVWMRSRRGVDPEQAKALVPAARAAAQPFPDDPAAQNMLAEAEFDASNFAEAESAADRVLHADPKSVHALVYKARAEMGAALAAKDRSEAKWREIRKLVAQANRADQDDPYPFVLFYLSYTEAGLRPTTNAVQGLATAALLAPQDMGLRMMVAHQHLLDGNPRPARAALAPIAFDPHGGRAAELAGTMIALIDKGDAKGALDAWEKARSGAKDDNPDD